MTEGYKLAQYAIYYPVALAIMGYCVLLLIRGRVPGRSAVIFGACGIVFALVNFIALNYPGGYDFSIFYAAGAAARAGSDPYIDKAMVSPPTALPLFIIMASASPRTSLAIWTALNIAAALALVPLALSSLREQSTTGSPHLERHWLVVLTAAIVLSLPIYWGIGLGQLSLFVTIGLVIALLAQGRGMPILAGIGLGLASMKPHTMLPFLILFLRRSDIKAWTTMAIVALALCLASGSPTTLATRVREELANIAGLSAQGEVNDYSFQSYRAHTIVGIDRTLYCLGLRNRGAIRVAQMGILGLIGLGLSWQVARYRIRRTTACALVSLFAFVFLYHRIYDGSLLVVPLLYSWARATDPENRRRLPSVGACLAIVTILVVHPKLVDLAVERLPAGLFARRFTEAIVLPYASYCVLAAMLLLYWERPVTPGQPSPPRVHDKIL